MYSAVGSRIWSTTSTELTNLSKIRRTSSQDTTEGSSPDLRRSMTIADRPGASERHTSQSEELDLFSCQIQRQQQSQETARKSLNKRDATNKNSTDAFYASYLSLRSQPVSSFLGGAPPKSEFPITSIPEDRLLRAMGMSAIERNQIEGLVHDLGGTLSESAEEQQISRAIVRFVATPPPEVGRLQQKTASWPLRPFPLGLRFSGKNMSPLPGCVFAS